MGPLQVGDSSADDGFLIPCPSGEHWMSPSKLMNFRLVSLKTATSGGSNREMEETPF